MEKNAKIYVAGHVGMLGSALVRCLKSKGYENIIGKDINELDLTVQTDVEEYFASERPDYVILAAAKVGGIGAMTAHPAAFLTDNLRIQSNVLSSALKHDVKKLLFISSAVVYPAVTEQPISEDALLTGKLDASSESYALAKIAGIKQCAYYKKEFGADFISAIPANIYGPNGIFDIKNSHVIPAMIRRFHSAKVHGLDEVTIWGTGNACRELMYSDDVADGCVFLMENQTPDDCYNLGRNEDNSMLEIAKKVAEVVGYNGKIATDPTKPEGAGKRLLNSSRINQLGWHSSVSFEEGLKLTYQWFLDNISDKDVIYR